MTKERINAISSDDIRKRLEQEAASEFKDALGADEWWKALEEFYNDKAHVLNRHYRNRGVAMVKAAEDLVEEGQIEDAMRVAEFLFEKSHSETEDTEVLEDLDTRVAQGEKVHAIDTTRGHLCWFLQKIVGQLDNRYFSRVLDLLDGSYKPSSSDPLPGLALERSLYIRTMATVPLSLLAANKLATKNKDDSPFEFGVENLRRTNVLAWRMLEDEDNYTTPRVLEYITHIFGHVRELSTEEAQRAMNRFLYDESGKYQPDYVLEPTSALLLYYAEIRSGIERFEAMHESAFDPSWFREEMNDLAAWGPPNVKSHIVWQFYKFIEGDLENFEKIEKYLDSLFKGDYVNQVGYSAGMLIEELLPSRYDDAISLYEKAIAYVKNGVLPETDSLEAQRVWLSYPEKILPLIAERNPEKLVNAIHDLYMIWGYGGRIGDLKDIFETYSKVSPDLREQVKENLRKIYEDMRALNPNLQRVDWDL